MRVLAYGERLISGLSPPALAIGLIGFAALKSGVWYIPNLSSISDIATNPFVNPLTGDNQYLFTNWFGPWLAWMLNASSPNRLILLHATFSVLFLSIFFVSTYLTVPEAEWRKSACIFVCLPVASPHLYWIGMDSILLFLMICALLALRRPWLALLIGVPLGLQHAHQSVVAFGSLLLIMLLDRDRCSRDVRRIIGTCGVLVGIGFGRAIFQYIIDYYHISITAGRTSYMAHNIGIMLAGDFYDFPALLYSFLGIGWLFYLRYLDDGRNRLVLSIVLLGCIGLSISAFDSTRVFAMITFPVLAYCWLYRADWLALVPLRTVVALLMAWAIVPWIWSWGDKPRMSALPYDMAVISNALSGWPPIPVERALWPF